MKIKSGDMVRVIAGNDRGKTGQVLRALPSEGKVIVEGVNIRAKHVKGEDGGIIRAERPIQVSNVALDSKSARSTGSGQATSSKADDSSHKATKGTAKKAPTKKVAKKTTKKTDK